VTSLMETKLVILNVSGGSFFVFDRH